MSVVSLTGDRGFESLQQGVCKPSVPRGGDRVVRKYATGLGLDRGYSAHPMRATFIMHLGAAPWTLRELGGKFSRHHVRPQANPDYLISRSRLAHSFPPCFPAGPHLVAADTSAT